MGKKIAAKKWVGLEDSVYIIQNNQIDTTFSVNTLYNNGAGMDSTYTNNSSEECHLFDYVYCCNKMNLGNGDYNSGEGSKFKGVGFIHLTGKVQFEEYLEKWNTKYNKNIGLDDFMDKMVNDVKVGMEVAMMYWEEKDINAAADKDDINEVTVKINPGKEGLPKRKKYFNNLKGTLK